MPGMAPVRPSSNFREWLGDALTVSGLSKREVARRMAAKHPSGVKLDTIETARRTINKILAGDLTPTQPTRDSIAEALEREDAPSVDDDEDDEPVSREAIEVLGRLDSDELLAALAVALKTKPSRKKGVRA